MSGWQKGRAAIDDLLRQRSLELLTAATRSAAPSLARARRLLASAGVLLAEDPDSAYVLAYDAARQAGTAVLAAQGLRATARGGHLAVEQALVAQFTPGFADFHVLRRRRNELEYPNPARPDSAEPDEAAEAIQLATGIVEQAAALLPQLHPW